MLSPFCGIVYVLPDLAFPNLVEFPKNAIAQSVGVLDILVVGLHERGGGRDAFPEGIQVEHPRIPGFDGPGAETFIGRGQTDLIWPEGRRSFRKTTVAY